MYTTTDEVLPDLETFDGSVRKEAHMLTVRIEGYAKAASSLDNTLDTISTEVEVAMAGDETINSLAESSNLVLTELEFDAEAQTPHGLVRLTYEVLYRIDPTDPETALA